MFEVRKAKNGRGVFATDVIPLGEILEVSSVLLLRRPWDRSKSKLPWSHVFPWDDYHDALALGKVSLCNHSDNPNAGWALDKSRLSVLLISIKNIRPDDEILIDYGCDPWW